MQNEARDPASQTGKLSVAVWNLLAYLHYTGKAMPIVRQTIFPSGPCADFPLEPSKE